MNTSIRILLPSLRRIESILASQASQYLPFPRLVSSSLPSHDFLYNQQKVHFSSKLNFISDLITTNDWPNDFGKLHFPLTHEIVMYVLKNFETNPQKALDFFNWVTDTNGFTPTLPVCNLMLRILGKRDNMNEFWGLIKKMSDQGYVIDFKTYRELLASFNRGKLTSEATAWKRFYSNMPKDSAADATVSGVVDVILGSDWNDVVKKNLGKLKFNLCENIILRIIWDLYEYPLKALSFFRWLKEEKGYIHKGATYNCIVRALAQKETMEEFWSMVKELQNSGHDIDIDTYVKISRYFGKNKMLRDSVELYELMMDGEYKPPSQNCSLLLKDISLTDNLDIDLVYRIVKKHEATGYPLSKAVYDWMYRCLTIAGKFDEADKIFVDMRNAGFEPDNVTYNHGAFGLCKAKRLGDAIKVIDKMEPKGYAPDMKKTLTLLIEGHCAEVINK